ncbi:MAG: hypothetical protein IPI26_05685 [Elusimicrobia bacterium]|nr:hypothetical protein [Elusimicrobiota bacterium]
MIRDEDGQLAGYVYVDIEWVMTYGQAEASREETGGRGAVLAPWGTFWRA